MIEVLKVFAYACGIAAVLVAMFALGHHAGCYDSAHQATNTDPAAWWKKAMVMARAEKEAEEIK